MDLFKLARKHIEAENDHDVVGTLDMIGKDGAFYKVYSNNLTFTSRTAISDFYSDAMKGIPDMHVEIDHMIKDEASRHVFVQYRFTGTHSGHFYDLPPTGKKISYHGGILYKFDRKGKLVKEVTYFDKTEILASIGLLRDTNTQLGKFLLIFWQSPIYTLKAAVKTLFKSS